MDVRLQSTDHALYLSLKPYTPPGAGIIVSSDATAQGACTTYRALSQPYIPTTISGAGVIAFSDAMAQDAGHHRWALALYDAGRYMRLDAAAQRALNVLRQRTDANDAFSLYGLMNRGRTAMSKRLLKVGPHCHVQAPAQGGRPGCAQLRTCSSTRHGQAPAQGGRGWLRDMRICSSTRHGKRLLKVGGAGCAHGSCRRQRRHGHPPAGGGCSSVWPTAGHCSARDPERCIDRHNAQVQGAAQLMTGRAIPCNGM